MGVVVAQLAVQSLPNLEDLGSNPAINMFFLLTDAKNKEKEALNGQLKII